MCGDVSFNTTVTNNWSYYEQNQNVLNAGSMQWNDKHFVIQEKLTSGGLFYFSLLIKSLYCCCNVYGQ